MHIYYPSAKAVFWAMRNFNFLQLGKKNIANLCKI